MYIFSLLLLRKSLLVTKVGAKAWRTFQRTLYLTWMSVTLIAFFFVSNYSINEKCNVSSALSFQLFKIIFLTLRATDFPPRLTNAFNSMRGSTSFLWLKWFQKWMKLMILGVALKCINVCNYLQMCKVKKRSSSEKCCCNSKKKKLFYYNV